MNKRTHYNGVRLVVLLLCLVVRQAMYAQAVYESNVSNGDWDDSGSWVLASGSPADGDGDGVPDSNDDVTILSGHTINIAVAGTTSVDDLTITGTLNFPSNGRTLSVGGNLTMTGTSSVTGNNNNRILNVTGTFNVSSGATATINGQQINITGTTTLDGSLTFASTTGNKTLGTIDVNASGTWDNDNVAEDFVITGDIINDGTWNGCFNTGGCTYELTSSSGTISGSSTTTLADITINSPASITNNGTVLLTDDLTGDGTLTNGATGDFQIQGTGPFSLSNMDFTTSGNTVTYTNTGNTTILTETYHNVVISKTAGTRAQLASTITVNNDVTVTSGEFRINAGTANITGDLLVQGGEYSSNNTSAVTNVTGDINMSSGLIDHNNGDVNVTGDLIISGGTMTMNGTTSTIDVDDFTLSTGDVTLTQGALNVNNASGGGLTVNSGSITMANAAITLTVDDTYRVSGGTNDLNNGTLTAATLTIDNGDVILFGGVTSSVSGTTTVNGTLTTDANGGTKTFNDITVSATGNWNVTAAESFTINGNIVSNGTWTGCSNTSCVYTLTSSSGTISGSTQVGFGTLTIDAPGSYTNTGSVQVTNDLLGTGTFINGNGSTLELNGAGPFSITTLNASTNSNTVTYSGGSNVTVNAATYHNLTINKTSNTATIDAATTVNNDLTVQGGILAITTATVGVTNDLVLTGGEFTPNDVTAVVNVGGNMTMSGASTLYDHNNGDVNVTGNLTVSDGTLTMDGAASTFDVNGTYQVSGGTNDFNAGAFVTGVLTVDNGDVVNFGGLDVTINGATTANGTITVDGNGGTKTFDDLTISATGNWNVTATEGFTINGNITNNGTWTGCSNTTACPYDLTSSSGTISGSTQTIFTDLNLTAPASYSSSGSILITDELTGTGSFTNANGSTLELSGGGPFSVTTFDASAATNTVTYSGTGSPTLNSGSYYNLIVNKSTGTINIDAGTTVANDLSIQSGVMTVGAATLGVTNDILLTGGEFSPNDASAVVNVGGDITMSGATTLYDQNNGDVNVTGNLTVSDGTLTVDGASSTFDVGGTYQVSGGTNDFNAGAFTTGALTVDNSQTVIFSGASITVTGATTANGTITVDNAGGTKTFGDLTISATGNWNVTNAESFTINGNIVSNGTWTGCSNTTACTYDLTSSSGTITGTTDVTFADLNIDAPGSYTNSQDVIVTDDLTGTGTFINANGSTLEMSGDGPLSITTFNASANSNTVTFSGGSNITVNAGDYYNLIINKSGNTATISGTTNIGNDLTVQGSGILSIGATTVTVINNVSIEGGELTPNDVSAIMNVGGNFSMSSGLFDHNDGDVSVTGDFIVTGGTMTMNQGAATSTINADDFTIATGSVTLSEGEFNVNSVSGGLTVSSGTFTLAGTALTITNDYTVNGGTNDLNGGTLTVVDVIVATSQTVLLGDATLNSTGTANISGTLTTDDTGGTKSFNNITVNGTGSWNVTAAESFSISGDITNNGTWTGCSALNCNYTLTSTSGTISGSGTINVPDIIIDSPASYTSTGNLAVTDRITGTGIFVNGASASLDYSGNNSGGANFNITNFTASATGNTVTYSRAGNQQLRTTTDTDNNYYNVVISTAAAGNDVSLAGDITIDNQLTMTLGDVILGSNRLTMADGATISGGDADSFIRINGSGVVRQNYSSAGSILSFPIGDTDEYSPITAFRINSATFGAGAYLEFDITDADHPNRDTGNTGAGGDDDGIASTDYISRYWTVTPNNITSPDYDATYIYLDADITGTEANMVATVYRTHPTLGILDWLVAGSVNPTNNTVFLNGGDAFGDLYAMDNGSNRLPITLLSFNATLFDGEVIVEWSTAEEIDNDFFTIERSTDGFNFQPILFKEGAGDSNSIAHYAVTDREPLTGRSYYRLKQTDFDGSFTYSQIVSITNTIDPSKDLTFKNVLTPGEEFLVKKNGLEIQRVTLFDLNGVQIANWEIDSPNDQFRLRLPQSLNAGIQLLRFEGKGFALTRKVMVQF